MSQLDQLPPDQRAVLSLVLDRGKSYGEVADMLAIPEGAVRDRAHAALDALAADPADPGRSRSEASAPAEAARAADSPETARSGQSASASPSSRAESTRAALSPPSSRTGGALLLGAIVAAIVVAVVLISSGGGKGSGHTSSAASTSASTSTSTAPSGTAKPTFDKTLTLASTDPAVKAAGIAYVLSQGGRRAFYVAAQGLPASSSFFYAVWLYNSPTSSAPLGRAPTVDANGRMQGGGPLPTNAGSFHKLIVTRETSSHPTQPGPAVLSAPFALH